MSVVCCTCSTPIPDESRFCLNCGSSVSHPQQRRRVSDSDGSAIANMERLLRTDTRGEYEIERLLGTGGMAAVYLATETRLARKVAIKVLPPELTYGRSVERFIREAQTAASLEHSHIIPIFRVASGDQVFWYAMKYIEGRTLEHRLRDRKMLALDETIALLSQVGSALDYAHARQVVHRDIKPANIMIDGAGRPIVTDFGIAKAMSERTLTMSGTVVGTPNYMSSEQAVGDPVAGASDQYSLAVIAYQMLAGHLPFEGGSAIDIVHKHCMIPPPPLDALRPGLPAHVYAAIDKALAKKPADRFPTVSAFVEGLRRPWDDGADTILLGAHELRPASLKRRNRPRYGLGALTAAAVLVTAAGLVVNAIDRPSDASNTGESTREPASLSPRDTAAARARSDSTAPSETSPVVPAPAPRDPVVLSDKPAARTAQPAPPVSIAILQTQGGWADIYVDGQRRRQGSAHRDTLPPGTHTFRFERQGYATIDTTVTLGPGETIVRVTMRQAGQ